MGELLTSAWFIWLMIGVFALIVEICTTAMVSIWFVPAAVITSLLSLICPWAWVQVVVFLGLSAAFLWLFKKKFSAKFSRGGSSADLNPDSKLIGKTAVAQSVIDDNDGKVLLGDVYWRAVSEDGSEIQEGSRVTVQSVSGTVLTVKSK
ncbi:MAG: NfeD family protein [Clostridia bacterium]|nr:NfeD family protein [Clostridia bacterium]